MRCRLPYARLERHRGGGEARPERAPKGEEAGEQPLAGSGTNKVERLLGRELCVLAWGGRGGAEGTDPECDPQLGRHCSPEERWWLFSMAATMTGTAPKTSTSAGARRSGSRMTENPTGEEVDRPPRQEGKPRAKEERPPLPLFGPLIGDGAMDAVVSKSSVTPFSLKDAPSLIERVWPAQKISVEAQKERKAGSGQTLTALGSYWKGRKPLILVRACVLGALLPSTGRRRERFRDFRNIYGSSDAQVALRLQDYSDG